MKILFVSNRFPTVGQNIHTYNLAKTLSESHELCLICFKNNSPYKQEDKYFKKIRTVSLEKEDFLVKGFKSLFKRIPYCVITHKSREMEKEIKSLFLEDKFDAVIFEPLVMGQYFSTVNNCATILFSVDATSRIKEQKFYKTNNKLLKILQYLDYLLVKKYETFIYGKVDSVMFVSPFDCEYTLKHIRTSYGKVHLKPARVDTSYFHPTTNRVSEIPSLVFVGQMSTYPNRHGMLWFYHNVWKRLKEKHPEMHFYIVGNNPGEEIKNLALMDKNIIVTGYVDDIRPYIWDASVFISPLQVGTGMKNKVLQAMAMGKAVVASPLDVQGINIINQEHIFVAEHPEDFIKYIDILLQDKECRTKMEYRAREFIEKNHSLENEADIFIEILNKVLVNKKFQEASI